jgi:hypothetical protein
MKHQTKEPSVKLKTKRISAALRGGMLAGLIACLAFNAPAAVQITRFDPPLNISAFTIFDPPLNNSAVVPVPNPSLFNILAADLNADGEVDFRLAYGWGGIDAYFNAPVRFAQRVSGPDVIGKGGPVAAVPLNSVIGTNIVSALTTNYYVWSSGETNSDDLTQPFGDHQATVIIANLVAFNTPLEGVPQFILTNGIILTNVFFPPVSTPIASGDVVGKEGVMALEFYVNGQPHYGYSHFNFNGFAGGVIYGWSYETEPNVAIEAKSLALDNHSGPPASEVRSGIIGFVHEGNLLGWTITVSSHGAAVTNLQTDDVGLFKVNLPPGSYDLTPIHGPPIEPASAVPNNSLVGRSRRVTVLRNHFRFIEMTP